MQGEQSAWFYVEEGRVAESDRRERHDVMGVKAARLFLFDEEKVEFIPVAQKGLSENYIRHGLTEPGKIVSVLRREGHLFPMTPPQITDSMAMTLRKLKELPPYWWFRSWSKGCSLEDFLYLPATPDTFLRAKLILRQPWPNKAEWPSSMPVCSNRSGINTGLFLDLAVNINSSLNMRQVLDILTAQVAEALKVKASSILLINEKSERSTLWRVMDSARPTSIGDLCLRIRAWIKPLQAAPS